MSLLEYILDNVGYDESEYKCRSPPQSPTRETHKSSHNDRRTNICCMCGEECRYESQSCGKCARSIFS